MLRQVPVHRPREMRRRGAPRVAAWLSLGGMKRHSDATTRSWPSIHNAQLRGTGRGNSLAALGRPEKALVCFDKALAIDPGLAAELGLPPRDAAQHEELPMKDDSTEIRIYKALVALLQRGTQESFVIIDEPRSKTFVQFDNGRCLGMDVPCVALTSAEADRASQLFKALGEEYPREYHDLDTKTERSTTEQPSIISLVKTQELRHGQRWLCL